MQKKCFNFSILFYAIGLQTILSMPLAVAEEQEITPSHVFQKTEDVLAEIELLREVIGITDVPVEPEPQSGKTPIHAYGKGLEVLEKVSRAERKLGMVPAEVGEIPLKEVKPADVFQLVESILLELRNIKRQLVISGTITEAEFAGAKTPSHVYENLWYASYMLDGLAGEITPDYVYRNIQYLLDEMNLIAAKTGAILKLEPDAIKGRQRVKNVAQQGLLALYKMTNFQRRLNMNAAGVPNITLSRITPSDVYDITNMLMAEMVRIKVHLGIQLPRGEYPVPSRKSPNDVFGMMQLVVQNMDTLIKAADTETPVTPAEPEASTDTETNAATGTTTTESESDTATETKE